MIKQIKRLLFGKEIKLSESEAAVIAKKTCLERGFQWLEPVNIKLIRGVYSFWINAGSRGNNFWVKIDAESGEVEASGVTLK